MHPAVKVRNFIESSAVALFVRSPFSNPFSPFALAHSFSPFFLSLFFFSFLFAWPRSPWSLDRRFLFSILIHRRWPVDGKRARFLCRDFSRSPVKIVFIRRLVWSSIFNEKEKRERSDISVGNDSIIVITGWGEIPAWVFINFYETLWPEGSLLSSYEEINEKFHVSRNWDPFL